MQELSRVRKTAYVCLLVILGFGIGSVGLFGAALVLVAIGTVLLTQHFVTRLEAR